MPLYEPLGFIGYKRIGACVIPPWGENIFASKKGYSSAGSSSRTPPPTIVFYLCEKPARLCPCTIVTRSVFEVECAGVRKIFKYAAG